MSLNTGGPAWVASCHNPAAQAVIATAIGDLKTPRSGGAARTGPGPQLRPPEPPPPLPGGHSWFLFLRASESLFASAIMAGFGLSVSSGAATNPDFRAV